MDSDGEKKKKRFRKDNGQEFFRTDKGYRLTEPRSQ